MKKTAIVLALVLVMSLGLGMTSATADNAPSVDNVVSINVWPYLMTFFNLEYERKLADALSLRVRGMYFALLGNFSDGAGQFYGFGGDIFFYPAGTALSGFYVGPRYDLFISSFTSGTDAITALMHYVGGSIGHRWVFESGFTMAISLGAWANVASTATYDDGSGSFTGDIPSIGGPWPTFNFDIGYGF